LVADRQRAAQTAGQGHSDRVVDGLKGSPRRSMLRPKPCADLRRPFAAQPLPMSPGRTASMSWRTEADLQAPTADAALLDRWRTSRPALGARNTCHRATLAASVGPGDPVLCLPRGGAADHLHHQLQSKASTALCAPPFAAVGTHPTTTRRRRSYCTLPCAGVSRKWKNAQREWTAAMTQLAIMFGDRFSIE